MWFVFLPVGRILQLSPGSPVCLQRRYCWIRWASPPPPNTVAGVFTGLFYSYCLFV